MGYTILHFVFVFPLRYAGADFFCSFAKINFQVVNMCCIFVATKAKKT